MSKPHVRLLHFLLRHFRALTLVAMLLMAGLLFWGRLLMQDVPRTAIAVPETHSADQADDDQPPPDRSSNP